jgi:RNA polymerase sporulation-specific sigma factor
VVEFQPLAFAIASGFYLPGAAAEDLRQEALVGVLSGLRSFDSARGVPLERFVALAVYRQLVTALRAAGRFKHGPLSDSVRHVADEDGEPLDVFEVIDSGVDVHGIVAAREQLAAVMDAFATLTPLERRWLLVAINQAHSPDGYAAKRDGRNKQAENAVDRARAKLRRAA